MIIRVALVLALPILAGSSVAAGEEHEPRAHVTVTDRGRVRAGFNVDSGYGSGGGQSGGMFGLTVRVGWQFDRRFGAYAQGSGFYWWSSAKTVGDTTAEGNLGAHLGPLFSFTLKDLFELAAGPSLDRLLVTQSTTTAEIATRAQRASPFDSAWRPGVHGHAAMHIGPAPTPDNGRRIGFTVGLDGHTTIGNERTLTFFTIGVGADWF